MANPFSYASEVKEVAQTIIEKYHPHLAEVRIEYIFTDKVPTKGGKEVWATLKKVSSLNAFLAAKPEDKEDAFYVMTVTKDIWVGLLPNKKEAMVDHYLCRAKVDVDEEGNVKLGLNNPDLEEFTSIVRRYGLWKEEVVEFVKTAKPHSELEEMGEVVNAITEI